MRQNYLIQITPEELGVLIKDSIKDTIEKVKKDLIPERMDNKMLTREDVSILLGKSIATIDNYKRNGLIPYLKMGNSVYFHKSDVLKSLVYIRTRIS